MPDRIALSVLADAQAWHDRLHGNPELEPWVKWMARVPLGMAAVFLGLGIGGRLA